MSKKSTLNLTLSVTCFAIVWELYQRFLTQLSVQGHPRASQWVSFLSAVGLFAFIFQLAMWLSHLATRHWLSEESKLVGTWFQVFVIYNYTKSNIALDAIRHGRVNVTFADSFLEITAENKKIDGLVAPSAWHSNKVSIQGSQVWLLFSSTGAGRGSTYGNMLYHYQARKGFFRRPDQLVGHFSDSSPATHFGSIELFRNEAKYEERLKQLTTPPVTIPS